MLSSSQIKTAIVVVVTVVSGFVVTNFPGRDALAEGKPPASDAASASHEDLQLKQDSFFIDKGIF